jgi:hypothetical protein
MLRRHGKKEALQLAVQFQEMYLPGRDGILFWQAVAKQIKQSAR